MWKEANLLQVLGVDEAGIQWSILNTQRGGNQKEKQEWFFVAFILSSRIVFRYNLEYLYLCTYPRYSTIYDIYDQS